jgi:hypothetical protein
MKDLLLHACMVVLYLIPRSDSSCSALQYRYIEMAWVWTHLFHPYSLLVLFQRLHHFSACSPARPVFISINYIKTPYDRRVVLRPIYCRPALKGITIRGMTCQRVANYNFKSIVRLLKRPIIKITIGFTREVGASFLESSARAIGCRRLSSPPCHFRRDSPCCGRDDSQSPSSRAALYILYKESGIFLFLFLFFLPRPRVRLSPVKTLLRVEISITLNPRARCYTAVQFGGNRVAKPNTGES